MAAPSGTVWGPVYGSGTDQLKLGIYINLNNETTRTDVKVEVWIATKYSVFDEVNTLYYNHGTSDTSATVSRGKVSINTTISSGSGWSTSNEQRLWSSSWTYTRGTSDVKYSAFAKLTAIEVVGTSTDILASTTFVVPKGISTYTVSYSLNGGSGSFPDQTKTQGTTLKLHSGQPTGPKRTVTFNANGGTCSTSSKSLSTTFNKWRDSSGLTYSPGDSYTKDASTQMTAQWINPTYGTLPTPSRSGYTFQGWSTASDGSTGYVKTTTAVTGNTTLYAVWKAKTYTIKFDANGGSIYNENDQNIGSSYIITKEHSKTVYVPNYTCYSSSNSDGGSVGQSFVGWATSKTATSARYKQGDELPNENLTLYPVYDTDSFTVKWSQGYGSNPIIKTESVKYGQSANRPQDPTREHYTFAGWLGEYTNIKCDKTIKALWSKTRCPIWIWRNNQWVEYEPDHN